MACSVNFGNLLPWKLISGGMWRPWRSIQRKEEVPSFELEEDDLNLQWTGIPDEASKGLMRLFIKYKETQLESLKKGHYSDTGS